MHFLMQLLKSIFSHHLPPFESAISRLSSLSIISYTICSVIFFFIMLYLSQVAGVLALLQLSSAATVSRRAFSRTSTSTALAASDHCGDEDYVILSGTPWIVYNMLYNADVTVGTQCTNFHSVETPTNGNPEVAWSSVTEIEYVEST